MNSRWLLPAAVIGLSTARPPDRLTAQTRPFQATDYYRMTFVGDPVLSPDGRRAAFTVTTVVEDKDRRHTEIWMAPTDGSAPPYRFTSPSFEAGGPTWSPDGSLLAFTSHREGAEDDVWFLRPRAAGVLARRPSAALRVARQRLRQPEAAALARARLPDRGHPRPGPEAVRRPGLHLAPVPRGRAWPDPAARDAAAGAPVRGRD